MFLRCGNISKLWKKKDRDRRVEETKTLGTLFAQSQPFSVFTANGELMTGDIVLEKHLFGQTVREEHRTLSLGALLSQCMSAAAV
ncbi:hypothetical protein AOLI_G00096190 [Acnodon oligacanthus]